MSNDKMKIGGKYTVADWKKLKSEIDTPIELKKRVGFSLKHWKSLSDLGKSNVDTKQIPASRKAL